jgi:hypothetical protein
MFDIIMVAILEPVFLTLGVLFVRLMTFGKYPSTEIKEKYKLFFEVIGLLISVAILVLIIHLFF